MLKRLSILAPFVLFPALAFPGDDAEKPFVKKRYSVQGTATIVTVEGETRLVFSEDFKTKNGPDL